MNTAVFVLEEVLTSARAAEAAGHWDRALETYEQALEQFRAAGGEPVAELLRKIGLVHYYRGNFEQSLTLFERSREIALNASATGHIAAAVNCLAIVRQALGQLDIAQSLYEEAHSQAVQIGDDRLAVMIDQNLGTIASIRGDSEQAHARYNDALQRYTTLDDVVGMARTLNNIGMTQIAANDLAAAERSFDQGLLLAERSRDAETLGTVQLNRADLYLRLERYDDARACCDQAFEIFSRVNSTSGLGETYKAYGILYRQSGKLHLAEAHLAAVSELASEADHPLLEAEAERERALVHLEQGKKSEALRSLNRAHHLFNDLRARRELVDIDRELDSLEQSYLRVVQVWGESIETRDRYTAGHCARVADYAALLAQAVGFKGRDLTWIRMGAFLHDVGKTRLSAEMLNKPTDLDDSEWAQMRQHTIAGDEIVSELDFPYDLRPMVRSHHERWDGTGYPDNLMGNDIPLVARILCIADVFDAMTTDRSYRSAHSKGDALTLMAQLAGTMVDPELFQIFRSLIEEDTRQPMPRRPEGYGAFLNRK
ncbi:MAG TPA: tetratricopeptide repeat protein [Longimicrobiales bacterium]|nr:tetratricopeptide repeat protein [Longimicrobiales bacterium]